MPQDPRGDLAAPPPGHLEGRRLAKPNYQHEKRQRDLAKKKKLEEKRQRKLTRPSSPEGDPEAPPPPAPDENGGGTPTQ